MVLVNGKRYFRLYRNQSDDRKNLRDILYFLAKNY